MINRVLLAGRLVEAPRPETTPGGTPRVVLTLELRHPRWGSPVPDVCTVTVHALGAGRAEVLTRYLEEGRDLMLEGQLREHEGELIVFLDRFHFMKRGLSTRYLWHEAQEEERKAA